jgi:hypothetical protein
MAAMLHRSLLVRCSTLWIISALWTSAAGQEPSLAAPVAARDTVRPRVPNVAPKPSIVAPRVGKASRAVLGSRVRIQYTPTTTAGTIERLRVAEGTLAAIEPDRFVIALDTRDTTVVYRPQAIGIMVQERAPKRSAAIGAAVFGLFMGTVVIARNSSAPDRAPAGALKGALIGVAVGVAVVALSPDRQWAPATFPP